MRNFHVGSALVGAALLGLVGVVAGAQIVGSPSLVERKIRVVGIPDPREIIEIEEPTPYVVPAGKAFVVVGFGDSQSAFGSSTAQLLVDGATEITWTSSTAGERGRGMKCECERLHGVSSYGVIR